FPEDVNGKKPHEIEYAQIQFGPLQYVEINRIVSDIHQCDCCLNTQIGISFPFLLRRHDLSYLHMDDVSINMMMLSVNRNGGHTTYIQTH
ncbi:hypothetical protein LDENG_00108410, partial [Lucifuga dentata]